MLRLIAIVVLLFFAPVVWANPGRPARPIIDQNVIFEEVDGVIAVEAEHFQAQTLTNSRAWYLFSPESRPKFDADPDPPHLEGASGGAYLEILPDTRATHGDKLKRGENFSNEPGKLAVLHYKTYFNTPGKYYVWARIYSTGTEDNGLHVGLNGQWPETGRRMQWTAKHQWVWGSKQRTREKHGGVKHLLYLEIPKAGYHVISFAMREDGTEFDKWMMTLEKLDELDGQGPRTKVKRGQLAKPFTATANASQANDLKTGPKSTIGFDPQKDLISLHYDHAPDRDDGHSAAADRTILETLYGADWLKGHVLAVSGAYGRNKKAFNERSDAVMVAVFADRGGWIAADRNWSGAVKAIYQRWMETLNAGGDVYVKEGGQSDITADVVRLIQADHPDIDTTKRIVVVQHSNWNENKTTDDDLAYIKQQARYIRIKDANRYLNEKGGDDMFEQAALAHPKFGESWKAAFEYYNPDHRLDFSDTGELMHILGLGELGIDTLRQRFLDD